MRNNINGACISAAGGSSQGERSEDCPAVQYEAQTVLEYLADEFRKQLRYADRELSQSQELLNDAIDSLIACFTSIHRCVDAITQEVRRATVEAEESSEAQAVARVLKISSRLETDINTAIRTLQFQDLMTQLIGHAIHRVSAMNDALSDIKSIAGEKHKDSMKFIDYLYRHKESILQKVANLDEHKTNPVSQGHMGTGEIELF